MGKSEVHPDLQAVTQNLGDGWFPGKNKWSPDNLGEHLI